MLRVRKSVVIVGTLLCLLGFWSLWSPSSPAKLLPIEHKSAVSSKPAQSPRIVTSSSDPQPQLVVQAFEHAWNGYAKYCFGRDSLHPVSNKCDDDFGGLGATAIDSLSTAILMQNEPIVLQILNFIAKLNFKKLVRGQTKLQSFEVIIRHFGGMISAYDLLEGPYSHLAKDENLRKRLHDQMIALGDILTCSFKTGAIGVPRGWVDPNECVTDAAMSNTIAGVGTMVLEFGRLSDITGDPSYVELAKRAEDLLINTKFPRPYPGLLGSLVGITDGKLDLAGSWGAPCDSYYEYLLKAYVYNQEVYAPYLKSWLLAADSTIRYIASHPYGYPEWTLLPTWNDKRRNYRMDSLSWFAGGNFILGGIVTRNKTLLDFGLSIADTAGAIYNMTATGLGPEFVDWIPTCDEKDPDDCDPAASVSFSDKQFKLRPEVLETWYYAYRATHNPKYREWSWAAFEAMMKYCRTPSGFSAISNVDAAGGGDKLDMQESFVLAEVLKYIWLIFADDDLKLHVQDSRDGKVRNTWVLNTEAHPLKVAGRPV